MLCFVGSCTSLVLYFKVHSQTIHHSTKSTPTPTPTNLVHKPPLEVISADDLYKQRLQPSVQNMPANQLCKPFRQVICVS
jgi:hypothetical protein